MLEDLIHWFRQLVASRSTVKISTSLSDYGSKTYFTD